MAAVLDVYVRQQLNKIITSSVGTAKPFILFISFAFSAHHSSDNM